MSPGPGQPRSLLPEVRAVVSRFDEAAWAALASRGLLRRAEKDLQTTAVAVVTDGDVLALSVGPRLVTLTPAGPAQARCSCPAPGVCRHIITGCLWLAAGPEPGGPTDAGAALHQELMALSAPELTRFAGIAGYRWAYHYLADAADDEIGIHGGAPVTILFSRPPIEARYAGGGPAGFVLDPRPADPARVVVAAVLAYQRAHGGMLTPPEAPAHRAGDPSSADSRRRLLRAAGSVLVDTVRAGVSHGSAATWERYATLATWAQGAQLYRLARLLQRLADGVDQQLQRSARADEHQLLQDAALAFALVRAIEAAGESVPVHLAGRARARYDPVPQLELLGLGGYSWRSPSGFHGLTLLFFAPRAGRFRSWTDARPLEVDTFDPRRRWEAHGPWSGLGSPAAATGRRVLLRGAQVSEDGRVSGVERTEATLQVLTAEELLGVLPVADSWDALARRHDPARRSLLAPPDPLAAWAVLRPAEFRPPRFDLARQVLTWPLADAEGRVLDAELAYEEHTVHAISRVEALDADQLLPGTALVARLQPKGGRLVAEPLSLIRPLGAGRIVNSLHFDAPPKPVNSRIVAAMAHRPAPPALRPLTAPLPSVLADLAEAQRRYAERGTGGADAGSVRAELARLHRRAREAGFSVFADPADELDVTEALLRSVFVLAQVTVALTGDVPAE